MSRQFTGMFAAALSDQLSNDAIGNAFMTGLILLVVVFAALIALALVIWLFGQISTGGNKEKKAAPPAPVSAPAAVAKPAPSAVATSEDEDEVAAVIAAAVAMMAPEGVTYRVQRITPTGRPARPAWAAAAVRQNTQSF